MTASVTRAFFLLMGASHSIADREMKYAIE
jgi:hypothetical protein